MTRLRRHTSARALVGGVYAHAVIDGDYAFLSGQLAADAPDGVELGDIRVETRVAMELLGTVLDELGLGYGDVVRVGIFMTDLSEFAAMNATYESFFTSGSYPARTCVGVASLLDGCRIEIDGVARVRKDAPQR